MSENLFPRNTNYDELVKLNGLVTELVKNVEMQQKYIEKIPDNVHQSVEESCGQRVVPNVNEFTHDEITSMYYHIQTSMNDEYKKQAKKIEQIMDEKLKKSISSQHRMLVDTTNDIIERLDKKQRQMNKLLFINTIISGAAAVLALICIFLTII